MKRKTVNYIIVLLVVIVISTLFFAMIRHFLMVILLSGIFAGMFQPFYRRIERLVRGRKNLASLLTLLLILLILVIPLTGLFGIVTAQAIKISQSVKPWIEQRINEPTALTELVEKLPYSETLVSYKQEILQKGGEMVGKLSNVLVNSLSSATLSTINFFFLFFAFMYTLFFFLKEGDQILEKILYYLPMTDEDERRMLDRFTSVTRATIKGTLLIGVIQGGLAGLAFWVAGIDGALFWGTVMTVLSIIPAIGSSLVWFPAVLLQIAAGHFITGIALLIYCGLLVGSVDNLLRPRWVGRDTQMHELLIFFSTLGGIGLFGIIGFIIGPIIAALFVTVWAIYGETFKDFLPEVRQHRQKQQSDEEKILIADNIEDSGDLKSNKDTEEENS